jgi:hypothetical protein
MDVICSSEMLNDFQRTTWCYIPEDSTLHNHWGEDLKSYIEPLFTPYRDHMCCTAQTNVSTVCLILHIGLDVCVKVINTFKC